jgi:tetratricopeptide (TPR) repeat protein
LTSQHDNLIFFKHFFDPMRLIHAIFILFLALMTSAQCQQTAEDWDTKGNALFNQGKYDEAIQAYDEAIRLDPKFATTWTDKGGALLEQSRNDEAIRCFDKAIDLMIQVQNTPISTAITGLNNAASENNAFKILGIDSTAYPK